jgi:hypothetical protein
MFNMTPEMRDFLLHMGGGLLMGGKNNAEALGRGLLMGAQGRNEGMVLRDRQKSNEQDRQRQQMQMDQFRQQQSNQQGLLGAARTAFAQPNVNLVSGDDEGNAMPQVPGGGGLPEFMRLGAPYMSAEQIVSMNQKQQPDYMPVAPGASVIDKRTGKPVFQAPEKPPEWKDPEYQKWMLEKAAAGRSQVTTNVTTPRETFKDSLGLKKDFDSQPEVKGFKEVQGAWDQIRTALQKPSPANDLAASTKYMKLLDPGSVVRESELAMAMQASGAFDRLMNYHNRLLKGEKLTPQQRQDFYSAGEALYTAAKGRYGETVNQYEGIAEKYGLDPQFIARPEKSAPVTKNMTATHKARQAIKAGADPDAVKRRLREQGYDDSGL